MTRNPDVVCGTCSGSRQVQKEVQSSAKTLDPETMEWVIKTFTEIKWYPCDTCSGTGWLPG